MMVDGFVEYKRRAFCKDVKCSVQTELSSLAEGSPAYEDARKKCSNACLYTTWQFHRWLIGKGYLLVVSAKLKGDERTVLVNLDKEMACWVDQQVAKCKFEDRSRLIQEALAQYRLRHEK